MKRVVITGMGVYSTIGKNLDEVRDSLYNGKSGIGFEAIRKEYDDSSNRFLRMKTKHVPQKLSLRAERSNLI